MQYSVLLYCFKDYINQNVFRVDPYQFIKFVRTGFIKTSITDIHKC